MPEEMFYIVLGSIVVTAFVMGFSMTSNVYSPPEIIAAGSYFILGGIVVLIVVVGVAFFEIKPRLEDWYIENRDYSLDRKERKIELKEREAELKQKEKEFREQEKQNSKPKKEDKIISQSETMETTQPETTEKIVAQSETKDEPILKTGDKVDPKLQNYEPIQTEITDKQYGNLITEDVALKIMWTLLKIPGHTFENRNKLRLKIEGENIKKTTYGDIFDELAKLNLINKVGKEDYINKRQSKWVVELSDLGIRLMSVARKEKITTWGKFSERFKDELAT